MLALLNTGSEVELQDLDCCPANCSNRSDLSAMQFKMIKPAVATGTIKWNNLIGNRVKRRKITAFKLIAQRTAQSQISRMSFAAVLLRKNMIVLEVSENYRRRDQTVLASSSGALVN